MPQDKERSATLAYALGFFLLLIVVTYLILANTPVAVPTQTQLVSPTVNLNHLLD